MAKVLPELGDPVEWVPSSISEAARDKNNKNRVMNTVMALFKPTVGLSSAVLANIKLNTILNQR